MKSEEDDHHTVATASDDDDDFLHLNERSPSEEEEVAGHSACLEIDDKEMSVSAAMSVDTTRFKDLRYHCGSKTTQLSTTRDRLLLLRSS